MYFVTMSTLVRWMKSPVKASQMRDWLRCNPVDFAADGGRGGSGLAGPGWSRLHGHRQAPKGPVPPDVQSASRAASTQSNLETRFSPSWPSRRVAGVGDWTCCMLCWTQCRPLSVPLPPPFTAGGGACRPGGREPLPAEQHIRRPHHRQRECLRGAASTPLAVFCLAHRASPLLPSPAAAPAPASLDRRVRRHAGGPAPVPEPHRRDGGLAVRHCRGCRPHD